MRQLALASSRFSAPEQFDACNLSPDASLLLQVRWHVEWGDNHEIQLEGGDVRRMVLGGFKRRRCRYS